MQNAASEVLRTPLLRGCVNRTPVCGAEHRAERYRWAYGLLGLRVVARKDGTLEVSGTFGERVLAPGEPRPVELPPPGYESGALSVSSDSQR